ncbi:CD1845 family protein [Desulfosporosinus shakirovi]|uniref:CD1845 family protein n=1 Tax=Desulfosporosinus shakirovi TaxID=2885154 RepID=UPI001E650770|nr:CD1845 family protein [Desulfosporosinus sp. SRJS8]MCB8818772.1 CD1845 family protein [Desulfosporosinus sp. SRJS8]
MKILLKIIAIPFIIVLSITVAFLYFIFCVSEWIGAIAAALLSALGALTFITGGSTFNGVVLLVLGFLISPLGLRAVIEWFIDRLADLNYTLKDYVMG